MLNPGFVKAWAELCYLRRASASRPAPEALAASKAVLERLEQRAPDDSETAFARICYLAEAVESAQALAMGENFAESRPTSADVHIGMGWSQWSLGQWNDAIASMRQVFALDPVDPQIRRPLISIVLLRRRLEEARAEQRGLIALRPNVRQEAFKLGRLADNIDGSPGEMERFVASIPRGEWEKAEVIRFRSQWAQIRGERAEAVAPARVPVHSLVHTLFAGMAFTIGGHIESAKAAMAKRIADREKKGSTARNGTRRHWPSGRRSAALVTAAEVERMIPDLFPNLQQVIHARPASICAWAGDKDRALLELIGLLREPGVHFMRLKRGDDSRTRNNVHKLRPSLEFSPRQGDPRFEALLNDPKHNGPLF